MWSDTKSCMKLKFNTFQRCNEARSMVILTAPKNKAEMFVCNLRKSAVNKMKLSVGSSAAES